MAKSYSSLRFTMLTNLLFALGVAIALFILSNVILDKFVNVRYLADARQEARIDAYAKDLQKYVDDNDLSVRDASEISKWAKENKYFYIIVNFGDELVYETGSVDNDADDTESKGYHSTGITVKTPAREELRANAIAGGEHKIKAKDGTIVVFMTDYAEYLYYDVFNILSILLAFGGFVLVMWFYFFDIAKKITRLGREVTAVADGDVNRQITADGEDEITRLCADVEYMRISMLDNIEKEHAALESNRELITAMSHDIRTPLTVLLGYLDIMKSNAPDPDMQQYIEASERTALRLKKMSDDMFGYFLAYGGGIEVSVEECEARTLIDQMLSGHVFLLREQGYTIDFNFENEHNEFLDEVIVVTDPPQLMRIVENLLSNVMKYADKEKPVSITIGVDNEGMMIHVSNYIAPNPDLAQKNGVGLRSCKKLANALDIVFNSEEKDGMFTSTLIVPIVPSLEDVELENHEESEGFTKWLKSVLEKCKSFFVKLGKKTAEISVKTWQKLKSLVKREK